jgi:hypothetical protein
MEVLDQDDVFLVSIELEIIEENAKTVNLKSEIDLLNTR